MGKASNLPAEDGAWAKCLGHSLAIILRDQVHQSRWTGRARGIPPRSSILCFFSKILKNKLNASHCVISFVVSEAHASIPGHDVLIEGQKEAKALSNLIRPYSSTYTAAAAAADHLVSEYTSITAIHQQINLAGRQRRPTLTCDLRSIGRCAEFGPPSSLHRFFPLPLLTFSSEVPFFTN